MIVLKNIFFHKSKVSKYLIHTNLHKLKTSFNPIMPGGNMCDLTVTTRH